MDEEKRIEMLKEEVELLKEEKKLMEDIFELKKKISEFEKPPVYVPYPYNPYPPYCKSWKITLKGTGDQIPLTGDQIPLEPITVS